MAPRGKTARDSSETPRIRRPTPIQDRSAPGFWLNSAVPIREIGRHELESFGAAPTASGGHYDALGPRLRFCSNRHEAPPRQLRSGGSRIVLPRFRVQEAVIAREGYGVAGAGIYRAAHELIRRVVVAVVPGQQALMVLDTKRNRRRTGMAAENEVDLRVVPQNLAQRQAEELAIVAVEKRVPAAREDGGTVDAESELIRAQFEIVPEGDSCAMRHFDDVVKAQPAQIIDHSPRGHLRHDDLGARVEQFLQRRSVKMVPMQVSQVNVLRRQILHQIGVGFREIPPAAPVT